MSDKEVDDFIKNCKDPKLVKYLDFRYTPKYKERLEQDRIERAIEENEQAVSDMEDRRTRRQRPK